MLELDQQFYGCYLLISESPKPFYKGRTYIGFTTDPNRRINQHNAGVEKGGAKATNNRGPWKMVMIVHGFPNEICALRFEWAWQNPDQSRRLSGIVPKKKPRQKQFDYKILVLGHMLNAGPWNRLPLTVRWLIEDYMREFPPSLAPPLHMPTAYGPVSAQQKHRKPGAIAHKYSPSCFLCSVAFDETAAKLTCQAAGCRCITHATCLAAECTDERSVIPVEGTCPRCGVHFIWGHLVARV